MVMTTTYKRNLIRKFSNVFARLQYKINFDINNTSSFLLATDLLRDNSKRRLLKLVATNVETVFLEILSGEQKLTSIQSQSIVFSLIKKTTQEFLTSCYGYPINLNNNIVSQVGTPFLASTQPFWRQHNLSVVCHHIFCVEI